MGNLDWKWIGIGVAIMLALSLVGGLLIAVFTGWVMTKQATRDELTSLNAVTYEIWHFLIRFVVPPALLVIFVIFSIPHSIHGSTLDYEAIDRGVSAEEAVRTG